MNELVSKSCELCGGNILNKEIIEEGFLFIGKELFRIKSYPGFRCSDCEEQYIRKDTKELFIKVLSEGNYEAVYEEMIPVYDFGTEEEGEKQLMHRVGQDGLVYCIDNVPVLNNEQVSVRLKSRTYQYLRELHKRVENGEENKIGEIKMITVVAQ